MDSYVYVYGANLRILDAKETCHWRVVYSLRSYNGEGESISLYDLTWKTTKHVTTVKKYICTCQFEALGTQLKD